jgi:gas vesicle protein
MALAERGRGRETPRSAIEMGYFRGLTHGAIVGAVLGLLYAPESGIDMRRRVSKLLGQAEEMMATDATGAPMASAAGRRRTGGASESRTRRP